MTFSDVTKTLERFVELTCQKIVVIAAKVNTKAEKSGARKALAGALQAIAADAKKQPARFSEVMRSLPRDEQARFVSSVEKTGVLNIITVFTPAPGLKVEDSDDGDDCLDLKERAKMLDALAEILDISDLKPAAVAAVTVALAADITAQLCEAQEEDEQQEQLQEMEDTVKTIEQQIVLLDQKLSYIMDLPDGAEIPETPRDSTPVSLTMIDDLLETMDQKLSYIMDLPDGADIPETPPDTKPVSLTTLEKMLEATKKFYKFEGTFVPSFEKDKQLIRIGPLSTAPIPIPPVPLLVTGFIDLSAMRENDVVTITTKVLEPTPSPSYVIWRVKTFTGTQVSGMKHFQDFSDLLEVPGDGVEVLIAQSASAHNFDGGNLINIPYQFLVESTTAPDFVLT